ncbi:hypothetical protein F5B19DRAFT_484235 [Rostrohypoxylon terebratum]|nr:hypothetical protein F5B19DRAFT_484235 [Rostrohypoxylon terebratum]
MDNGAVPALHPYRASPNYITYCIITGVLFLLAAISVTLRFIQRIRMREIWWDDWAILCAIVFDLCNFISAILNSLPSLGGAGYHTNTYTLEQFSIWAKISLICKVLYNLSVSSSRLSIILFYRRIFSVDDHFLLFMRIMLFLIIGEFLVSVFGLIFSTNPVQGQFDPTIPHTTIHQIPFYIAAAVINFLIDAAVLVYAQVGVWKLQLDTKRRILLSVVFLIGVVVVVASIVRIVYFEKLDMSDPTYTLTAAGIWTNAEMSLSIICACLPLNYSLFRVYKARLSRSANSSGENSDKKTGSLVTFGRAPPNNKRFIRGDVETHSMAPLDPVRVRTEYSVSS